MANSGRLGLGLAAQAIADFEVDQPVNWLGRKNTAAPALRERAAPAVATQAALAREARPMGRCEPIIRTAKRRSIV